MKRNQTKNYTKNILAVILLSLFGIVQFAFAQSYYDPYNQYNYNNYNNYGYNYDNNYYQPYSQPYGVTTFGGQYDYYNNYNSGYNSGYNNVYVGNNYTYPYNYASSYIAPQIYSYQSFSPVTYAATNVYRDSGTINGYITLSGNNNGYNYGNTGTAWFQYGVSANNLAYKTLPANIYSSTSINSQLTGLGCGKTYYFRAVTRDNTGLHYGSTLSFTTANCYYNYSNYYPYNYYPQSYPVNIPTNCVYNRYNY